MREKELIKEDNRASEFFNTLDAEFANTDRLIGHWYPLDVNVSGRQFNGAFMLPSNVRSRQYVLFIRTSPDTISKFKITPKKITKVDDHYEGEFDYALADVIMKNAPIDPKTASDMALNEFD